MKHTAESARLKTNGKEALREIINGIKPDDFSSIMLKSVVFAYANMTVTRTPERSKNELWYKQAVIIDRYFFKNKKKMYGSINYNPERIIKKFEKIKEYDLLFFEGKDFSEYICMIYSLDYLINVYRDMETRVNLGHINTILAIHELSSMDWVKDIRIDANKYMSGLIDIIESKDV